MKISNPLVGTWKLISCENHAPDGTVTYPFGENPLGYIFYREDGYMSVEIMRTARIKFSKDDMWKGTTEEDSQAIKSYLSYAGKYTFQGNKVTHHIEVCSFPNWSGTEQSRQVKLQGNQLTLTTPPTSYAGIVQVGHVLWQKVS